MKLKNRGSEIFLPAGGDPERALRRTTHLGVVAHPDDLEILAYHGILECYRRPGRSFFGVVVADGAGSARGGAFARFSDREMARVRRREQKKAAVVGEYGGVALLNYPSARIKSSGAPADQIQDEIQKLVRIGRPSYIYTHNLADRHPTHVAVALRTISALRGLPARLLPKKVYGCEVWRDLDWLADEDKIVLDVSRREELQDALLNLFESQNDGGKLYNLATKGRRRANATYQKSHAIDRAAYSIFAMDLTLLARDPRLEPEEYVAACARRFMNGVRGQIRALHG